MALHSIVFVKHRLVIFISGGLGVLVLFALRTFTHSIPHNGNGLLLCWYFMMSSPELKPIEKLMMKITTKAHLYSSARTKADSGQNDEYMFVSQHSSKPNVIGRHSCRHCDNSLFSSITLFKLSPQNVMSPKESIQS